jgi:hypothetical protein
VPQIAHSQINHAEPYAIHSIVTPQQALALASALEDELIEEDGSVATPPAGDATLSPEIEVRICVVNALDELLANNPTCAAVVIERLEWFGSRICGFLGVNAGKHAVCGSAAGIIASLSRDEEAAVKLVCHKFMFQGLGFCVIHIHRCQWFGVWSLVAFNLVISSRQLFPVQCASSSNNPKP